MSVPFPLFNCQQATLLIERRADERLPLQTRGQLWAHLRLCHYCRRYAFQSPFIARQAKAEAHATASSTAKGLPLATQRRLQLLLDAHADTTA